MFTCFGDGSFNMDVPLDENGQITVYAFCEDLAPFKKIIYPAEGAAMVIELEDAYEGAELDMSYTLQPIDTTTVRLNGTVSFNGIPVCAMALANGQYTFTCSGDGSFSMDVPLDDKIGVTLFIFCDGLIPYKHIFAIDQIDFTNDADYDGYSIVQGDSDDTNPHVHPASLDYSRFDNAVEMKPELAFDYSVTIPSYKQMSVTISIPNINTPELYLHRQIDFLNSAPPITRINIRDGEGNPLAFSINRYDRDGFDYGYVCEVLKINSQSISSMVIEYMYDLSSPTHWWLANT